MKESVVQICMCMCDNETIFFFILVQLEWYGERKYNSNCRNNNRSQFHYFFHPITLNTNTPMKSPEPRSPIKREYWLSQLSNSLFYFIRATLCTLLHIFCWMISSRLSGNFLCILLSHRISSIAMVSLLQVVFQYVNKNILRTCAILNRNNVHFVSLPSNT